MSLTITKIRQEVKDGYLVVVKHAIDEDADSSYLQPDPDNSKEDNLVNAERLEGLRNGDWYYMGIIVEIYQQSSEGPRLAHDSLWGIESDSGQEYVARVEKNLTDEAFAQLKESK